MSRNQDSRPIYARPPEYLGETPFEGDLFGREALAKKLTAYLLRLRDGCVVGIDARWGDGKTWFGHNWRSQLDLDGFRTIYMDAFEQDYLEDPFNALASRILAVLNANSSDGVTKSLWESSVALGKTLLPATTKIGVNALGRILLGTANLAGDAEKIFEKIDEKLSDAAESYVAERLKDADSEKHAVDAFRKALAEFAARQEKPVVFFIDELDRCRPDFAVRIIERVKHFFDVPNLIFVLLLNRTQLEQAIRGTYGDAVDAHAYLGKFVHLFFSLPKQVSQGAGHTNFNWIYAWKAAERYRLEQTDALNVFIGSFARIATALDLSLRDIEKAIAILAMSGTGESVAYLSWPIALKLKAPGIVSGLFADSPSAHQEAIRLLSSLDLRDPDDPLEERFWVRKYFLAHHNAAWGGHGTLSEDQKQMLKQYGPHFAYSREGFLKSLLKRIDIAILD